MTLDDSALAGAPKLATDYLVYLQWASHLARSISDTGSNAPQPSHARRQCPSSSRAAPRAQLLALRAVATMPPSRAATVKPWATTRARIISCEWRVLPLLKLMRP